MSGDQVRPERSPSSPVSTGPQPRTSGFTVSPHHLASAAGIEIMKRGGNAVDASIAINAVLGVVLPDTCGPGGDLFAIVHVPGEAVPRTLNSSGRAGSGITADELRGMGHGEIPLRSPWSISVPGCVDGWHALSHELGNFNVADCLQPAIDLARNGFPVSRELANSIARLQEMIGDQGSSTPFYPGGDPVAAGTVITRPRHANTLEAIASGGRDAFYDGEVGNEITKATEGAVTPDDLAVNQAQWIEPATIDLFGRTAWTIPPNSQGYLTLAALWIFEALDPPDDPGDPLFHHLLIEAYRSVAWERARYVTEPTTAPLAPDQLLSHERLGRIAGTISRTSAGRWPMPVPAPAGTAYMNASDPDGMAVSYIQSNYWGIGSGLSAGASGVFLHNRGAGFNLIPGHPNEYQPGNRPMHTLSPTLWTSAGELDLVLGTRGGDQQPQFLAQFAALHFHADLCIDDAQDHPRWNMEQPEPGTDSSFTIEPRFPARLIESLRDLGHDISDGERWNAGYGPIAAIDIAGKHEASADPRVSTSAALAWRR